MPKSKFREILRGIVELFGQADRVHLVVLLLSIFVGAIFEAVGIGIIAPFVAVLNDPTIAQRFAVGRWFVDTLAIQTPSQLIVAVCISVCIAFLLKNVTLTFLNYRQLAFIFDRQIQFSVRLFARYLGLPYLDFIQRNSSELIRNLNTEVSVLFNYVIVQALIALAESTVVVLIVTLLLWVEPVPTLAAFTVLSSVAVVFQRWGKRKLEQYGREQQAHLASLIQSVKQGIEGIKEIKILGVEQQMVDQYAVHARKQAVTLRYLNTTNYVPRLFIEVATMLAMSFIVGVFILQGRNLTVIVPSLGLFAMAAFRLMPSFNRILIATNTLRYYLPALDVLKRDVEATLDGDTAKAFPQRPDGHVCTANHFECRQVAYRYVPAAPEVLHDVNFAVQKNQTIAIIGPSGSGKTTLLDILLGLLQPTQGGVTIDGAPVDTTSREWRANIGYVPQHVFLANDTVMRNVAFGLPDAAIDEAQVWSALEQAHLRDVVASLPETIHAPVGEGGKNFSGGQRQRIALARALYRNPSLLIFDEPTSALDATTEAEVLQALQRLRGVKTMIIVTHKTTVLSICDHVFAMQDGAVVPHNPAPQLRVAVRSDV